MQGSPERNHRREVHAFRLPERLVDVMTDCEKTANQIDSIGDELKQIGNSVSNVGRLLAGKGTKEVSDEKQGVGMTRIINMPVKKAAENLQED